MSFLCFGIWISAQNNKSLPLEYTPTQFPPPVRKSTKKVPSLLSRPLEMPWETQEFPFPSERFVLFIYSLATCNTFFLHNLSDIMEFAFDCPDLHDEVDSKMKDVVISIGPIGSIDSIDSVDPIDPIKSLETKTLFSTHYHILLVDCSSSFFLSPSLQQLKDLLERAHSIVQIVPWNRVDLIKHFDFDLIVVSAVDERSREDTRYIIDRIRVASISLREYEPKTLVPMVLYLPHIMTSTVSLKKKKKKLAFFKLNGL